MFAPSRLAPLSLLVAASAWGIVWYPYRLLETAGISGSLATLLTYLVGLALLLALFGPRAMWPRADRGLLLVIALAAGWTNLAYVLAVIHGEIMRVMLLFYLAPLWTLLFARLFLDERPNAFGYLVMLLSLAGAWVMFFPAGGGLPLPANAAEWYGLSAGCGFAFSNVLSRRLRHVNEATRGGWIFAGVIGITLLPVLGEEGTAAVVQGLGLAGWGLVALTGAVLVLATLTVQYGLAKTPANRAIVILLFELVVAALASWWLAGEVMGTREWLGGAMIVVASLFSGKMENNPGKNS
jgi:drug/metabolite transporter (DMT)-like permease